MLNVDDYNQQILTAACALPRFRFRRRRLGKVGENSTVASTKVGDRNGAALIERGVEGDRLN